jgi:hypothetical protein
VQKALATHAQHSRYSTLQQHKHTASPGLYTSSARAHTKPIAVRVPRDSCHHHASMLYCQHLTHAHMAHWSSRQNSARPITAQEKRHVASHMLQPDPTCFHHTGWLSTCTAVPSHVSTCTAVPSQVPSTNCRTTKIQRNTAGPAQQDEPMLDHSSTHSA